ncbi:MAG TPA: sorbosone dehydrogenase family protein [Terriglobia bacterium]|nr:sorbosone dehydrogenase family protein [Terriglobia bacterium]
MPIQDRSNRNLLIILVIAMLLMVASLAAQSRSTTNGRLPQPHATPSAMNFPKVIGWPQKVTPRAPNGFMVDALATDIESPRWLYVLPNGDLLVAQSRTTKSPKEDPQIIKALTEAGSLGTSPNQITLLRDANKDGRFETRHVFIAALNQPFGMAFSKGYLYVANTDSVIRYPYKEGAASIDVTGEKIVDLPAGGYNNHWTRNIIFSPAGDKLYITVGSQTNVDEEGLDAKDPHRAAILECNPDGSGLRVFASGLRNPNGLDWAPGTGALWTLVNERDELGDDLPPDFLTSVRDGGFYGWPYAYFGIEDPRHKGKRPDLVAKSLVPDIAVGAHTGSIGFAFYKGASFPMRYRNGAFIAQHGSWNRSKFSGYRVAFVPFDASGKPGAIEDFVTGFIASDERREVYGRPTTVAVLPGGSLAIADDAGNRIWRVRSTGTQ